VPDLNHRLQTVFAGLLRQRGVHHALCGIAEGDGRWRWLETAGPATPDGLPMTPTTPFFIASISKLFIAATILRLHERGALHIDEPMTEFLQDIDLTGLHQVNGVDYTPSIRVRHLLGHTSGLPDYLEERPRGGTPFIERIVAEGDREWGLEEVVEIVRCGLRPHFPPQPVGSSKPRARYSDTNYRLLIAIIESVTDGPLQAAFDTLLLGPLGLADTWLPGPDAAPRREPASVWFGDRALDIPLAMRAVGDLYSTADDLVTFMRSLVQGAVFERPETLGMMRDQRVRFGLPRDRAALRAPGWPIEYGLGLMRFALPRVFTGFRPMPALFGHSGSTGTWLFHCPELDLYFCGTVDQGTAGAVPYRLLPKLLRMLQESAAGE